MYEDDFELKQGIDEDIVKILLDFDYDNYYGLMRW